MIRASLREIGIKGVVLENGKLMYENEEVCIAYYRSGYIPQHYPTELEWSGREKIELSKAIKCPNINFHIAGCKKIQQCLTQDLSNFTIDSSELLKNITELYDFSEISSELENRVQNDPESWVLKPQREGGGNNTYGADILPMLYNHKSLTDYVLMKKINCKAQESLVIRNGVVNKITSVSEVGMFGVIIGVGENLFVNEYSGYLVRTKAKESNEGGVATGYAVLDSASLI